MFNKVVIDLLFNLLLSFVALFILAFIQVSEKDQDKNTQNSNHLLITMSWEANNDMDLWLMLPNGRHVGYSKRDVPPAHLDVDVVAWRRYDSTGMDAGTRYAYDPSQDDFGEYNEEHEENEDQIVIRHNQEIISVRDVLSGEYVVNVHYFSDRGYENKPIRVEILVQDVVNKSVIYAGHKVIKEHLSETHFVKFNVEKEGADKYKVDEVHTDRPVYFVGKEE